MLKLIKQEPEVVGWHNKSITFLLLVLTVMNFITLLKNGKPFMSYVYLVLPFLTSFLLMFFTRSEYVITGLCLYAGVIMTADQPIYSDLQGVVFFILAFNLNKNKLTGILVIVLTIISIIIRSFLLNMTLISTIGLLTGFLGCYLFYMYPILRSKNEYNR